MIDIGLAVIPDPGSVPAQVAYMVAAIAGSAVATGLYVGAGWGPGPRDGLMTGLAARGVPLAVARAGIEITVLLIGWALGGTVGVATVLFAAAIGPLVKQALQRLRIAPAVGSAHDTCDTPFDGRSSFEHGSLSNRAQTPGPGGA